MFAPDLKTKVDFAGFRHKKPNYRFSEGRLRRAKILDFLMAGKGGIEGPIRQ